MTPPNFLNVDLEIASDSPELLKLAEDFETKAGVLHAGFRPGDDDYLLALESIADASDPELAIYNLCELIEGFSDEQRVIWDNARSRLFDVGYDQDREKPGTHFRVGVNTLRRIVAANADFGVSVYRTEKGK